MIKKSHTIIFYCLLSTYVHGFMAACFLHFNVHSFAIFYVIVAVLSLLSLIPLICFNDDPLFEQQGNDDDH